MRRIETALLVDDDAAFRTTLQLALRRRGVQARTAATVDEGLIALEDAPADLVVLDNRMPHGDGMGALDRFRLRAPDAVILMLTGFGDIPLAVRAVRSGADAFLTKPVDADRLLAEAEQVRAEPRRGEHLPAPASTLNLEAVEREAISAALRQTGGVVAQAAKVLGIDRRTLQRKMRRMDRDSQNETGPPVGDPVSLAPDRLSAIPFPWHRIACRRSRFPGTGSPVGDPV